MVAEPYTIDVHLGPADLESALREDALRGLTATPKRLSPKWHYDARGSALFDEITRLPEYYLTRCERSILEAHAADIAAEARAGTLIELGSGTSTKTRLLLSAMSAAGTLERFVPFDVDEATLRAAAAAVVAEYPGVAVHAVVGDFERHLPLLPRGGTRLVAFLGSTIGNLEPAVRARFLADLAGALVAGDSLLLGVDLVKSPERILAAYDDPGGVTAAFSRNVLRVVNERLGADFDPEAFDHVARWDAEHELVDIGLRARMEQTARIARLGLDVQIAAGEEIHTEISAKFRRDRIAGELRSAGLDVTRWWTDPGEGFGVALARRI
ncbi:MAG TPA: L-histidine N(alpha)-methyltransferase [Gaiellales bacterium]|jgi:L-histidine Nalpha-methyltransferase|nr:L-histidine N(alpha)-methyltransferase [Gaiellales bacterium]